MKNIFIVIVILVAGVLGYLFFRKSPQEAVPNNTNTQNNEQGAISGKIDINAVCEGALSYMTFPDGASADAFVAECKEGKRPEVIEKYKADMNLGDGATI